MIIYPAIDCRNGKCVRLYQGDYNQQTIYGDAPIEMAKAFVGEGATWLHLVDLDGAKEPNKNQAKCIQELIQAVPIKIQIGGGIRTAEQIEAYLNFGAQRVVIGSLAVRTPERVSEWLKKYGSERLVLAFDVIFNEEQPLIATHGWQNISDYTLFEMISYYENQGMRHILCTDISKDGTLNGPNIELYQNLLKRFPTLHIQASGGIHTLEDIIHLKKIGVEGAITGRALYEKKFTLKEALLC